MDSETAVALALDTTPGTPGPSGGTPALIVVRPHETAAAPPGPLTSREKQIATLVARGRSNKAIAEELSISPGTTTRHVTNILAKLGFTTRTQLAAWVSGTQPDVTQRDETSAPS